MQITPPLDIQTAQEIRDNELFSAKESAKSWRNWTYGLGVLLAIATLGNVYQGTQHRWIMRYVEVDRASTQARVIDPAAERYEPSQDIAKATLESYIKAMRSISTDKQANEDAWNTMKVCLTPGGRKRLQDYESRYDRKKDKLPRSVQMLSRLSRTLRTYSFRWQEWTYDEQGQVKGPTTLWSANLTFERRDPKTEQELISCPTGIFLDTWELGKDM